MINDLMFSNIVLKQDLINDKKGLVSLLCPLAWISHGIYTVFAIVCT